MRRIRPNNGGGTRPSLALVVCVSPGGARRYSPGSAAGKMTAPHTSARLVNRRRALVKTNPPRNNQPETPPDDERGRQPQGGLSHG
jgi:hypothetical protein